MPITNFRLNGSDITDYFVPAHVFDQGQVWGWGFNPAGQLGDNTITNKSSPIQTVDTGVIWKSVCTGGGGVEGTQIANSHSAGIKTDGTLWTWGVGSSGVLGSNSTLSRSSPAQTISATTNWRQVSCGAQHTAAIKTDGTLWTWGSNYKGALGDNTSTSRSSPVQTVAVGANWRNVQCGGGITAAIKTDGTLWTWGDNLYGALGDDTSTDRSSPVQTIAGGTNWKQVSCGDNQMAAIKTDGTLWTWGWNNSGGLGDGTLTSRSSPVQTVAGGTNWKQVACGFLTTTAIKTDGTLWLWGTNTAGQLGDSTSVDKSSPVQTVAGGTNWRLVAIGYQHTAAIKTDGTLWTWGSSGGAGALGTGNAATTRSSPAQTVAGGTNWKSVSAGYFRTQALRV